MARKTGSHAEITGPRIRDAAERLFARHGYAAVSMRQIAAEVGVQAGAIYLYTSDKQSLLFELMKTHLEELLADWESAARDIDNPLEDLDHFVRFHIRFHLTRPDAVFIAYMELRNLEDGNFRAVEALRHRYEDELSEILKRGHRDKIFVFKDLRLTTMAVIALLTGITTWYRAGGRLNPSEIEAAYLDLVRGAVGASPTKL
jgi:AcrR family transcriptional regulator